MATTTATTGAQIVTQLVASATDDTILVTGGLKGDRIERLGALTRGNVTIRAQDPGNPPIFTGTGALNLNNVRGGNAQDRIIFDGIHFVGAGNTPAATAPQQGLGVTLGNASNLLFRNCRFSNYDQRLLRLGRTGGFISENITWEHCRFDRYGVDGVSFFHPTKGYVLRKCIFTDTRIFPGNPPPGGGNQNGTGMFSANRHPDAIQFGRNDDNQEPHEDVLIEDILIFDATGNTQGILMAGQPSAPSTMPYKYRNVTIRNVQLHSGRGVGIVVKGCDGLLIENCLARDLDSAHPAVVNHSPYIGIGDVRANDVTVRNCVHPSANAIPFREGGFLAAGAQVYEGNVRNSDAALPAGYVALVDGVNVGPYTQQGGTGPRVIRPIQPISFPVGTIGAYDFTQHFAGTDLTYTRAGSPTLAVGLTSGQGVFTMPPTPGEGVFTVRATNPQGQFAEVSTTITGVPVTAAPQIVSPFPEFRRTVGSSTIYGAAQHFSDADSYSLAGAAQVSIDAETGDVEFDAGATPGTYGFTVTASNAGGSVALSGALIVEPAAPTPPPPLSGLAGDGRVGNSYLTEFPQRYSGVSIISSASEAHELAGDASRLRWQVEGAGDEWHPFRVATPPQNAAGSWRYEMRPSPGMSLSAWTALAGLSMAGIRTSWQRDGLWSLPSTNPGGFTAPGAPPVTELEPLDAGDWIIRDDPVLHVGRFTFSVVTTASAPAYTALQYDLGGDGLLRNFVSAGIDGEGRTIWVAQSFAPGGMEHTVGYEEASPPVRLYYFSDTFLSPPSADAKTFTGPDAPPPVTEIDPGDILGDGDERYRIAGFRVMLAKVNAPAVPDDPDIAFGVAEGTVTVTGLQGISVGAERLRVVYAGKAFSPVDGMVAMPFVEGELIALVMGVSADGVPGVPNVLHLREPEA